MISSHAYREGTKMIKVEPRTFISLLVCDSNVEVKYAAKALINVFTTLDSVLAEKDYQIEQIIARYSVLYLDDMSQEEAKFCNQLAQIERQVDSIADDLCQRLFTAKTKRENLRQIIDGGTIALQEQIDRAKPLTPFF